MKYCLIRDELIRRNEEDLEKHRRYGAALIAKMIRDWWASVSEAAGSLVLLAEQHQWRAALRQNRLLLTQLTDVGANWMSKAIARSPHPPLASTGLENDVEMATVVDDDWLIPQSTSASSLSGSVESLPNSEDHFDPEDFSWGIKSTVILPRQSVDHSSCSEDVSEDDDDDAEDRASVSSDASIASTVNQEDVAGLVAEAALPLNEVMEPYLTNGWQPQSLLDDTHADVSPGEAVSDKENSLSLNFFILSILLSYFLKILSNKFFKFHPHIEYVCINFIPFFIFHKVQIASELRISANVDRHPRNIFGSSLLFIDLASRFVINSCLQDRVL